MPLQATSGAASYDAFGGGAAAVPAYIEEVFSTWVFTGTGSNLTIPNGIDLSTNGGLAWMKGRVSPNAPDHHLFDTARGFTKNLTTNSTAAQNDYTTNGPTALTNGFSIPNSGGGELNRVGDTYVSWTFRKQPKFFDVVTYTGNGTARSIAHSLGSAPGCVIIKSTSGTGAWSVWHRSGTQQNRYAAFLNFTDAYSNQGSSYWGTPLTDAPNMNASTFSVGTTSDVNGNNVSYVAYLFAHNAGGFGLTGTDNVISCGSFTLTGGTDIIDLGYEPQWLLTKRTNSALNWQITDNMRGMTVSNSAAYLYPNNSNAETSGGFGLKPTATGISITAGSTGSPGDTFIYIAIRRGPMKVPTSGTSVFSPVAQNGLSTVTTNFPVDLSTSIVRSGGNDTTFMDRLRGGTTTSYRYLASNSTAAESTGASYGLGFDSNTTLKDNWWNSGQSIIFYNFRRAPSFFDEVCYAGTGANGQVINHNLSAIPEMVIIKGRDSNSDWFVYQAGLSSGNSIYLNRNYAQSNDGGPAFSLSTTALTISRTYVSNINSSGVNYVAYLFATCAGVSKVGSYTGNGSTQTIDCGFTGGARFVLIKRTDSTGDWYVYDTARGMTVLTDPYLFLNNTDAESATLGSVTTVSTGFALNSTILAAINVSGGSYIFFAVA